jgi:hypothetical protein
MFRRLKEFAGVVLKDAARYRDALESVRTADNGDPLWLHLCNRNEVLEVNPAGPGVRCLWRWTSDLHACGVRPAYARRLAQRAFERWPLQFTSKLAPVSQPEVSFIIAHEGTARIDHLIWTLKSMFGQRGVAVECVVVDQSDKPGVAERLPAGVRCFHRPRPAGLTGWRKSWAFNLGAREATGEILVFHDGDIVCPADYAATLVQQMEGYGAASIQRFLFNLHPQTTEDIFRNGNWPERWTPERVRQNWEGGTIAVRRDAFFEIGGYDEAFVGWGGEDNEFFDRCVAVDHLRFGFVPFVHLWHKPQADKHVVDNQNINRVLSERLSVPVEARIRELRRRGFGDDGWPDPRTGYTDG